MGVISIIGKNSSKLRGYYENLLGKQSIIANGDYVQYEEEKMGWGFDPKEIIEKTGEVKVGERQILIQLESDDIEEDYKKVKTLSEINMAEWGDRYFWGEDIEGNLLYVFQKDAKKI